MRTIKTHWTGEDGKVWTDTTSINGTNEQIRQYYVDKWFNVGSGGNDYMAVCTAVEFLVGDE